MRRFIGNALDVVFIVPAMIAVDALFTLNPRLETLSNDYESVGGSLYFGIVATAAFVLTNYWPLRTTQQTWAKRLLNMQIRTEQDREPTLSQLLVRRYIWQFPLFSVPYVGAVLGLVDALFIFNQTRQCAHDIVAGTKVIQIGR